jgi:protein ImuA
MATSAAARETVFALRQKIAKIEGRLAERLGPGVHSTGAASGAMAAGVVLRRGVAAARSDGFWLQTGIEPLDRALGGGLPRAALTEIVGAETRDAGTSIGFALALLGRFVKAIRGAAQEATKGATQAAPLLWIGTTEIFREAGFAYAQGIGGLAGIGPRSLLLCEVPRLEDALWVAEEASGNRALSAVVLELRGNPAKLDLTATRRLHRRAEQAGRPVFLLRQAAFAEPTAAPVRLLVGPAPAGLRRTLAGPLPRSIGPPAFMVTIGKSRTALPGQFIVEWNADELAFAERENFGVVVSPSRRAADPAAAAGAVMAFKPAIASAARPQPPRQEHPAHSGPRRAG